MAEMDIAVPSRKCTVCGIEKPETMEFFYFTKGRKPGQIRVFARCRACSIAKGREPEERAKQLAKCARYSRENRQKLNAKQRERRIANIEVHLEREAERRAKVPIEVKKASWARARVSGADRIKAYSKEYQARPEVRAREEQYRQIHRERHLANRRGAHKRRVETRPELKLAGAMSGAIWKALKRGKGGRSWESLVGYTREDLARHLERQFKRGMAWDNMGKWHIDHIVPRSFFKYTSSDDPDFKACWALTNLRPLWGTENVRKHAKRTLLL